MDDGRIQLERWLLGWVVAFVFFCCFLEGIDTNSEA